MAAPEPELVEKMHRYFAVECNNRAWALTEQTTRTEAEERELFDTAHAAAYHWSKVGTPVNDTRARLLLAEVYAQAGEGTRALELAEECSRFFKDEEGSDWDRAFATLELAFAHAVNGSRGEAQSLLEDAARRGELLGDKGEREFFAASHQRISGRIGAL